MPAPRKRMQMAMAVATLALACAACQSSKARTTATGDTAASNPSTSAAPSSRAATTASTAKAATTVKTTAPPPPGLGTGARGPQVLALEQKLDAMKYNVGKVDGVYDGVTAEAVIAFQKVSGMARTGRATDDVQAAVAAAKAPDPLLPAGGPTRVEVDLKRQVLFLYENGALSKTLMISSGGGYRYCVKGACDKAITPGGSFRVGQKIRGKHISPLGVLYNPLFFNGGIAIHGEPAVPTYPASHGCVRIPMSASAWFFDEVKAGTPVYVLGGAKAPVPFNTPAPDGEQPVTPQTSPTTAAPASTSTTATTAPASTTSSSTSTSTTSTSTSTTSTTAAPTTTTTTAAP